MAVDQHLEPNLKRLNNALREIPSFYSLGSGDIPIWYGRLLSNLLLLAGESEIRYVTGHIDRDARSVTVILFTNDLLVLAEVVDWNVDADSHSAYATRRSELIRVEVETSEGVFSQAAFSNWPTAIRMQLTYRGLVDPLRLPLESPMHGEDLAQIWDLLRTLLEDLTRHP